MNKTLAVIIVVALILVGVAVAVMAPKEPADETAPAATTPTPQSSQTEPDDKQAPVSGEAKADIKGFAFLPKNLTVKKGTTVTWTNQDSARHDVVSDEGAPAGGPSSSLLAQGESYSFTFGTVGTFPYHCTPHPYMKGIVTVTE